MIVERNIMSVKPGRVDEMLELIKEINETIPAPHAVRVYAWPIGASSEQVVAEYEYGSEVEADRHTSEWMATPESASQLKRYYELLSDIGHSRERWTLIE